ncbi:MAG TPA: glycosyltransferase [Candidatus Limnocylindrales bacterium]
MVAEVVVWVAAATLLWVYIGYPAVVVAIARARPIRLAAVMPMPSVAVAIAVHDENEQIAERIADVVAQDPSGGLISEILVGSDGSTDGTDATVAALAASNPRIRLLALARVGSTPTQHALFSAASADIVVLTDAETRFAPGCVATLAEAFRDPRVACATGRLEWRAEDATATSANEGLYWRYERAVRSAESRAGILTAVTGAILAVRRATYRAVPAGTSMDHLLPLYARADGYLVVYVPLAVATDRPISKIREQFRNRSRTATRGIAANLSMVRTLSPWRYPGAAAAIWSHKLLRWGTPILALLVVAGAGILVLTGSPGYLVVLAAAAVAATLAVAGHAMASFGRRPPRLLAFARAFAVVNIAFGLAWLNVVRGRRIEAWHRAEWHAGS